MTYLENEAEEQDFIQIWGDEWGTLIWDLVRQIIQISPIKWLREISPGKLITELDLSNQTAQQVVCVLVILSMTELIGKALYKVIDKKFNKEGALGHLFCDPGIGISYMNGSINLGVWIESKSKSDGKVSAIELRTRTYVEEIPEEILNKISTNLDETKNNIVDTVDMRMSWAVFDENDHLSLTHEVNSGTIFDRYKSVLNSIVEIIEDYKI